MTVAWSFRLPGAATSAWSTSACDAPGSSGGGGAGGAPRPPCAMTLTETTNVPRTIVIMRFIAVTSSSTAEHTVTRSFGERKVDGRVGSDRQHLFLRLVRERGFDDNLLRFYVGNLVSARRVGFRALAQVRTRARDNFHERVPYRSSCCRVRDLALECISSWHVVTPRSVTCSHRQKPRAYLRSIRRRAD